VRAGIGFDAHRFVPGRKLVLGGVEIPHPEGLKAHSDGDVLTHAIMDAILGALGQGDIGRHFPDTDPAYEGASSIGLLERVLALVQEQGFEVAWVDTTVICERPRLASHVPAMRRALASVGLDAVNIKASTTEGMGFTGRGEGIAAQAVCLLRPTAGEGRMGHA
jgi:2-C-methyl-D-erythritol 2,4-cyclodiphosphate synthase